MSYDLITYFIETCHMCLKIYILQKSIILSGKVDQGFFTLEKLWDFIVNDSTH